MAITRELLHKAVDVIADASERTRRYCYNISIERSVYSGDIMVNVFVHDMKNNGAIIHNDLMITTDEKLETAISAIEKMEVTDDTI